jgi:hypothetical protein
MSPWLRSHGSKDGVEEQSQPQPVHAPLLVPEPPDMNWHTPPAQTLEPQHWAPELQSEPSYQQQRESPVEAVYSQMAPVWGRLH